MAVVLIAEHEAKFIRSVYFVKFFDVFLLLLDDSNQKIQIEALQSLKTELRPVFKVEFCNPASSREAAFSFGRESVQTSEQQQSDHQVAGRQQPHQPARVRRQEYAGFTKNLFGL